MQTRRTVWKLRPGQTWNRALLVSTQNQLSVYFINVLFFLNFIINNRRKHFKIILLHWFINFLRFRVQGANVFRFPLLVTVLCKRGRKKLICAASPNLTLANYAVLARCKLIRSCRINKRRVRVSRNVKGGPLPWNFDLTRRFSFEFLIPGHDSLIYYNIFHFNYINSKQIYVKRIIRYITWIKKKKCVSRNFIYHALIKHSIEFY